MSIQSVHKKLIKKKLTISVAESCTGGLLAHNFTKLANSSNYFQMGLTTYSNQAKINIVKKYLLISLLSKFILEKINLFINTFFGLLKERI